MHYLQFFHGNPGKINKKCPSYQLTWGHLFMPILGPFPSQTDTGEIKLLIPAFFADPWENESDARFFKLSI